MNVFLVPAHLGHPGSRDVKPVVIVFIDAFITVQILARSQILFTSVQLARKFHSNETFGDCTCWHPAYTDKAWTHYCWRLLTPYSRQSVNTLLLTLADNRQSLNALLLTLAYTWQGSEHITAACKCCRNTWELHVVTLNLSEACIMHLLEYVDKVSHWQFSFYCDITCLSLSQYIGCDILSLGSELVDL